jgi:hypothetical protein
MSSWTSSPLPLGSQVGGHTGVVTTTEDGSLIIKEALPLELEFYQTHASSPSFEPLRPFLPKFYGTLKLEGTVDEAKTDTLVVKPFAESKDQKDECWPFMAHPPITYLSCFNYSLLCSKTLHILSVNRIFWTSSLGHYCMTSPRPLRNAIGWRT